MRAGTRPVARALHRPTSVCLPLARAHACATRRFAHTGKEEGAPKSMDLPSAAPAGTVFKGLSIYKNQPDPVALPDSEYPPWLWELLEDPAVKPTKTLMVGDIDTTGLSKGEARAALKRSAKVARAHVRRQQEKEAKEAAKLLSMSAAQKAAVAARAAAKAAEDARPKTAVEVAGQEKDARRALRKKNRAAIKANNFVRST
ncbi:hypothetical protein MVES1_001735 [Malassezia vespertilionis]|uniref:Large ribosomal subunit protein mL54 n=1 Tax=Malassezia vespertilionis TaxID=2020962 RepID=A0A2N1JCJ6_9BASI|nr:uncharacterized protein MVES1_001735 [Malassezia vespertilionis]PKI84291.1 hypothetical protein MVES_001634 [Malassezia vespertilionis]WFD06390.1 hypothetical protein MVES1_001735 [Malassezia vespertilionis]